jgi:hypothetical protein
MLNLAMPSLATIVSIQTIRSTVPILPVVAMTGLPILSIVAMRSILASLPISAVP